jgi:hypothetical protein
MALEDTTMTRSQPRHLGRSARLHGLFALMLAACVATLAIAAAVALLDSTAASTGPGSASQENDTVFAVGDAPLRNTHARHRPAPATRGKGH